MIVSQSLVKPYPQIAIWICDNIPKVRNKPKVFKAFQKYAGFKEEVAERALKHGNPPTISFTHMPGSNGRFLTEQPNTVFWATAICERFKNSEAIRSDNRMHLLIESTILHEMVHWGDWMDGELQAGEPGAAFEKEAYGEDIWQMP